MAARPKLFPQPGWKRWGALAMALLIVAGVRPPAGGLAGDPGEIKTEVRRAMERTVSFLHKRFQARDFRGVLDWPAVGLFAAGEDLTGPKWTRNGRNGLTWREEQIARGEELDDERSTDFERTIIGLLAAGGDPEKAGGIDLLSRLKKAQLPSGKFADSISAGGESLVNAHVWGIIALAAAGADIPRRQEAKAWLLSRQAPDGGFNFEAEAGEPDVDMTAMALVALKFLGEGAGSPAVRRALSFLKKRQLPSGGFEAWGGRENSSSAAVVIQGLVALGIDPTGPEWVREGGNPVTTLLSYQLPEGSFRHRRGGGSDLLATEQALIALATYYNGVTPYDQLREGRLLGKTPLFPDLEAGHWAGEAIIFLVKGGVLRGYPDGTFRPGNPVTRAEFAKYLVYGLKKEGLAGASTARFRDLPSIHWANPLVKVAVDLGYIRGLSPEIFGPDQLVTGAQVMAMLVRALGLEGEAASAGGDRWYTGYVTVAARRGLLYPRFDPSAQASRAQSAYAVYRAREALGLR